MKTNMMMALATMLLLAISCQSNDCERYHQNMEQAAQSTLIDDMSLCEGNPQCMELMKNAYIDRLAVAENCYQCCIHNMNCESCPSQP